MLFLIDPFMWLLIAGCIAWAFNSSTLSSIVVSQLPWLFIVLFINIFVLYWFSAIFVFAIVFIGMYLLLIKKTASWAKVLIFGQIFILLFLALVTDSMQMNLAVLDVIVVLFFMVIGMSVITYYVQHLKEQHLHSSLVSYKLNGEIDESSDFFDEKEQLIQDAAQIASVFCNEIKNYQSLADRLVHNTTEQTPEIMQKTLEWMKNKPILMTTGAYTWLSMQPIFSQIQQQDIDKNFILIPTENYDENLVHEILKTYYISPKTLELSKSMGYCSAANCEHIILPDMDWLFLEDIIFESHPEFNFKFVFLPFMIPKINYENLNKAQHASKEIATLEKLLTHDELKPFSNQSAAKINLTHRIRTNAIRSDQESIRNEINEINPTEIDPLVPNNQNRSNSQKSVSISTIIAQTVFILIAAAVFYFVFEKMEIVPVIYFYRVPLLTIGESLIAMIIAFTFIITFAQIIYYSLAKYKIGGFA
jgi:hypothetical protein